MSRAAWSFATYTCGHSDPVRGGDRVVSRPCGSCRFALEAIGPREVGGRYLCGYWAQAYTVEAIRISPEILGGWDITVRWDDGRRGTHATAWDAKRDRVLTKDGTHS